MQHKKNSGTCTDMYRIPECELMNVRNWPLGGCFGTGLRAGAASNANGGEYQQQLRQGLLHELIQVLDEKSTLIARQAPYSILMPPSLITLLTFSTSARTNRSNSSGVEGFGTEPRALMRSLISASPSTRATSPES